MAYRNRASYSPSGREPETASQVWLMLGVVREMGSFPVFERLRHPIRLLGRGLSVAWSLWGVVALLISAIRAVDFVCVSVRAWCFRFYGLTLSSE